MISYKSKGISREGGGAMKQTFLVDIVQQQNATWQGKVKWLNGGNEENFRSALELIRLIDSTLENISAEENAEPDSCK